MAMHSGKLNLNENTRGLFEVVATHMRRENRLKQLVHEAGGRCEFVQDECVVRGLTDDQFTTITDQLHKEFPLA